MTTATAPTFPIDDLLACARCGNQMTTRVDPQPRYVCPGPCGAAFSAMELYPLLLTAITSVVVTEATFPDLKASFVAGLAESERHGPADVPADEVILRIVNDPDTFVADSAVVATAELLGRFIERIELDADQATIRYSLPLPSGSDLAGSRRQHVVIPGTVTLQPCNPT